MEEKLIALLTGLGAFVSYFGASVALLALFALAYAKVTPYREINLIANGNVAAASSYSGAILGFTIPLASAVSHSVGLLDMIIWGIVALVVQLAAFGVIRMIFPSIAQDIPNNQVSKGIFLGAISLVIGIINAACMTY
ncbi:MAG: DUF350 domain-containing protein [Candidatus Contendobacter sp.]|nr:DUF350 domain-containing protein [Candidatus Contendobacter sp.]